MSTKAVASAIKGSLIAGALGDALGYAVEFDYYKGIQHDYGPAGIRDLKVRNGKAIISDDTQMTLFSLEAIIRYLSDKKSGSLDKIVYQEYLNWLRTQLGFPFSRYESRLLSYQELHNRRAPGNTCLNALESDEMGSFDHPLNHSKGCGGVMRTAPFGFVDDADIVPMIEGAKAGVITHGHPMGFIPAGMLSDIIYRVIYKEEKPLKEIILDSLEACKECFNEYPQMKNFEKMLLLAVELSENEHISDVDAIHEIGGGWVGDEALAIAIYSALRHPDNIKECLICAVNHDGDSDSTGAIAGNILGAYLGIEAVDPKWIRKLELANEMDALAEDLLLLIR